MPNFLTVYSQNDPKWSGEKLGNSNLTLGAVGCYISSFATLATFYQHTINPFDLNKLFIEKGLFSGGLISSDDDLSKVYPDITYQETLHYETIPADLQKLQGLLSDPSTTVICEIDLHNGSVHFTPIVSCDGKTVILGNVWNGQIENFTLRYGDPKVNILKLVVYKGTPAPDPLTVCEKDRDTNYQLFLAVCTALNLVCDPNDKQGTLEKVLLSIKGLQGAADTSGKIVLDNPPTSNSLEGQSNPIVDKSFLQKLVSLFTIK